jgi:hypothetical protein
MNIDSSEPDLLPPHMRKRIKDMFKGTPLDRDGKGYHRRAKNSTSTNNKNQSAGANSTAQSCKQWLMDNKIGLLVLGGICAAVYFRWRWYQKQKQEKEHELQMVQEHQKSQRINVTQQKGDIMVDLPIYASDFKPQSHSKTPKYSNPRNLKGRSRQFNAQMHQKYPVNPGYSRHAPPSTAINAQYPSYSQPFNAVNAQYPMYSQPFNAVNAQYSAYSQMPKPAAEIEAIQPMGNYPFATI